MGVEENLRLMQTLDNAWNAKDWETFMKRHSETVAVYWPGQPEPTRGRHAHHNESVEFFKAFDNHLDNNPYKILFGYGDAILRPGGTVETARRNSNDKDPSRESARGLMEHGLAFRPARSIPYFL